MSPTTGATILAVNLTLLGFCLLGCRWTIAKLIGLALLFLMGRFFLNLLTA